jgi:hypothetical protein
MLKYDATLLKLDRVTDSQIYANIFNALQEELCNVIESNSGRVTSSKDSPFNQLHSCIDLNPKSKKCSLTLTREEYIEHKGAKLDLEPLSASYPRAKAVSFILNVSLVGTDETGKVLWQKSWMRRFSAYYSLRINKWCFSYPNGFDNTNQGDHAVAIELTKDGLVPLYLNERLMDALPQYLQSKLLVFMNETGTLSINIPEAFEVNSDPVMGDEYTVVTRPAFDPYYLRALSVHDWRIVG